ncbi:hypothetical protein B0T14DRAFT_519665 [Immersiella caudata]|uniref:AAA+ ATPase domain-containing protein n=1 Tax=Immersiella caudata TaxID=314043 RepID=A0AA39WQD6_9PEZI|nr:hypothetical protein B0T14DRAFT_519665 [Immersiella caudata]
MDANSTTNGFVDDDGPDAKTNDVQCPTDERPIDGQAATSADDMEEQLRPGMMSEIKEFYRDSSDSDWDEWAPDDVERDHSAESAQHAIIAYRQKKGRRSGLFLHSLKIQSPLVRRILETVFEGYEGISTKLKELVHYAPFHEFYFRWHLFEKAYNDETDGETKRHLDLLYPIISKEILPHIEAMEDYTKNDVITFDHLWAIFPPGMTVYSTVDDRDRLFEVRKTKYLKDFSGNPYLSVSCRYIDTDGKRFGYMKDDLSIYEFSGVMKITELDVMPCHLHPDNEEILSRLHDRGAKFESYLGCNHVNYSGFYRAPDARRKRRHTDMGRFIIDRSNFDIYRNGYETHLGDLDKRDRNKDDDGGDTMEDIFNVVHRATMKAFKQFRKVMKQYEKKDFEQNSTLTLSSQQRMLCTPVLKGFCLTSKEWSEFYVDGVSEIEWNEDAFGRLVLAQGYKEIIHAFVGEQLNRDDSDFDDIISGKGQGFIMLLSGEPGVGKTLTAESVAEKMNRPLYSISAGELGETASEIETALETVLELVAKWRAILLLDECDIFLEARTTADIARNRLVSIFLRQLEYFRGVMFLTTNRVTTFDAAFESRIHLTIDYPALDLESRVYVWRTFLRSQMGDAQGPDDAGALSEEDLKALAEHKLNGRQIKNIVKTAWLLAKQNKKPLTLENLQTVLKVKSGAAIFGQ